MLLTVSPQKQRGVGSKECPLCGSKKVVVYDSTRRFCENCGAGWSL